MTLDINRQIAATQVQGGVAVGGVLLVCADRLVFAPHMLERALAALHLGHGKAVEISFGDIAAVGKAEGKLASLWKSPLSGGMWARLSIKLKDGKEELFVVNKLDAIVELIGDRVSKTCD